MKQTYCFFSSLAHKMLTTASVRAKLLTIVALCLFSVGNVWGAESTISEKDNGSVTNGFSWSVAQESGTNITTWNTTSKEYRFYFDKSGKGNGSSLTITPSTGITITKVVINRKAGEGSYSVDNNTAVSFSSTITITSPIATSLKIWNSKTTNTQLKISSIVVTYESAPSYTITPVANPEEGGTVEMEGNVITATPEIRWQISTNNPYSVTSGTATVVRSGNEFTVTPESDCTVQINFEPETKHTLTYYIGNESAINTKELSGGTNILSELPASPTSCDDNSTTFIGWTATPINGKQDDCPELIAEDATITEDMTVYAVFAKAETTEGGSGDYELVEQALDDWSGDYLIAYSSTIFMDGSLPGGKDGVGALKKSVNPGAYLSGNKVAASWGDEHYLTLEACTGGYVLKTHSAITPYIYQTTNSNGIQSTNNKETAAEYAINVDFTNSTDVRLCLTGKAKGAVLRYTTNGYFRFYKDGGQSAVYLYKKTAASTTTYTDYITTCKECTTILATPEISLDEPTENSVDITWAAVDNAISYLLTYTCTDADNKEVSLTRDIPATDVDVDGQCTYTLDGLEHNTTYTVTLQAINETDGFCSSGLSDAKEFTTKPIWCTITWMVNGEEYTAGNPITTVIKGKSITDLPKAPDNNTLDGCANTFMGWSAKPLPHQLGNTAPTDLFNDKDASPTIEKDTTFYAVFATGVETEGWDMLTTKPEVGDIVVIVNKDENKELTGVSGSSTPYGFATDYTDMPNGTFPLVVENGEEDGTLAFKSTDGYLSYGTASVNATENNLYVSPFPYENKTSWNVNVADDGIATIVNKAKGERMLWCYGSSPRFACYTNNTPNIQLYKKKVPTNYFTSCPDKTQLRTPVLTTKGEPTYEAAVVCWKQIDNAEGYILVYTDANNPSETITLPANATSYTFENLTPNTTYTVTLQAMGNGITTANSEVSSPLPLVIPAAPTYTITWSTPAGETTSTVIQGEVIGKLPEAPASCSKEFSYFVGWFTEPAGFDTEPSTALPETQVTAETVPEPDATYYAVFADVSATEKWKLVTSADDLVVGKQYTFASTATAVSGYVFGEKSTNNNNYQAANWMDTTEPTLVTLGKSGDYYTFYDATADGYLYAAGSKIDTKSNNYLKIQPTIDANAEWTITFDEAKATIKAHGENTNNTLQFNNQGKETKLFSCYASTQQSPYIFLRNGYISSCCGNPATVTVTPTETPITIPAGGENIMTTISYSQKGAGEGYWKYMLTPTEGATFDLATGRFTATQVGTYTLTLIYTDTEHECPKKGSATITVEQEPCTTLDKPTGLNVEVVAHGAIHKMRFSWIGVDNATEYRMSGDAPFNGESIKKQNENNRYYSERQLKDYIPGEQYTFGVQAIGDGGKKWCNSEVTEIKWTAPECTITLDAGNGKCETTEMTGGKDGIILPKPTACGDWTFVGWSETPIETETSVKPNVVDNPYTVTTDKTLYAVYTKDKKINLGEKKIYTLTVDELKLTKTYAPATYTATDEVSFAVNNGALPQSGYTGAFQMNRKPNTDASKDNPGQLYNTTPIPNLRSVTLNVETAKGGTIYQGTEPKPDEDEVGSYNSTGEVTFPIAEGNECFLLQVSGLNYFYSIEVQAGGEKTETVYSMFPTCGNAEQMVVEWKGDAIVLDVPEGQDAKNIAVTLQQLNEGKYVSIASGEVTQQDNDNGTISVPVATLKDLACQNIRITLKTTEGALIRSGINKVPIIVNGDMSTEGDAFRKEQLTDEVCATCDVVVRDGKTLSAADNGKRQFRNMYVYPNSQLNLQTGSMQLETLYMFAHNDDVSYAITNNGGDEGALVKIDEVRHVKCIDGQFWYPFSLPYSCQVKDIVTLCGKELGDYYNTETKQGTWGIKYYDGELRQTKGNSAGIGGVSPYWKFLTPDATLNAYQGYIIALFYQKEAEERWIEFVPAKGSVYTENGDKTTTVQNWKVNNPDADPSHHGWNFTGSPYISLFGSKEEGEGLNNSNLAMGKLGDEENAVKNVYVSIPNGGDSKTYTQVLASATQLKPFSAYFVQALDPEDGNEGGPLTLTYSKGARSLLEQEPTQALAPRRASEQQRIILAEINLTKMVDGEATALTDNAGVQMSDRFSDKYEIGYDLTKMYAAADKPQLYTKAGNEKMAYNALPDALAHDIPLGIYVPAAGEYRLSLHRSVSSLRDAAAVYVLHNGAVVADLLLGDYTLEATAKGEQAGYALDIRRASQVITGADELDSTAPYAICRDGKLVIGNMPTDAALRVYDVLGRLIWHQPHAATGVPVVIPTPQTGVYMVVVESAQQQYILKPLVR